MTSRETISLDARAQQRLTVLTHMLADELTLDQAAAYLHLSTRQVRRLLVELRGEGAAALVHGNRGRRPANRVGDAVAARIVELARTTYAGFNPVHLAECLADDPDEPLALSARTVHRILAAGGVIPARTRRRSHGHRRRERMPREGMLLQTDGSRHDWLEGRGPWLTLVGGIDDATSRVTGATFRAAEDGAGYFAMLTATARRHGLPLALYTDRHGVFIKDPSRPPTLAEQLTGRQSLTQVGRALDTVGVRWIAARSPQAKGRCERLWGTLQDRLVSELRRARVATLEDANEVLAWYLPRHNKRFAVPAADPASAWRPWPDDGPSPEAVFCFQYRRTVANDATLPWAGGSLLLPAAVAGTWRGRSVVLQERLDGSLWASRADVCVPLAPAPDSAPVLRARHLARPSAVPELLPAPEPVDPDPQRQPLSAASASKAERRHPWRLYPAVRPKPG
jgi:Helix-turn-helix domain